MPGFLDERVGVADATERPTIERPRQLDPLPDAPSIIDGGWDPAIVRTGPRWRGAAWLAVLGVAIVLCGWCGVSMTTSAISAFQVSPVLGGVALAAYLGGGALIVFAGGNEIRALWSLRRVDHIRSALADPKVTLQSFRATCAVWLDALPVRLDAADTLTSQGESKEQLMALLRNRLAERLRDETRRIGLRSAAEGSALVALSPHASWDGLIVAFYGLRTIRRIAAFHGLRPGAVVTLLLLRRVARVAVEVAAIDLAAQTVSSKLLENTPVVRHLVATIPGMGDVALRLYRLALAAGRACNPLPP
jgi:putative membrane protein